MNEFYRAIETNTSLFWVVELESKVGVMKDLVEEVAKDVAWLLNFARRQRTLPESVATTVCDLYNVELGQKIAKEKAFVNFME